MKLGIVMHPTRDAAKSTGERVAAAAKHVGLDVVDLDRDGAEPSDVDYVVSIGGDGTLLQAAKIAWRGDKPLLGIDVGYIGYLAEVQPEHIDMALQQIVTGPVDIVDRVGLMATLPDGSSAAAFNDVVAEKVVSQRVVRIDVEIDGSHFTTLRADGVILATPMGSTAYSLSAGGPPMAPGLRAMIMTPLAAHGGYHRPVVLEPQANVRLTNVADRLVRVNLDGTESAILEAGMSVDVTCSAQPLRMVSLGLRTFPHTVTEVLEP